MRSRTISPLYDNAKVVAGDAVRDVLCGLGGVTRVGNDLTGKINPLYRGSPLGRFRDRVSDELVKFCPTPRGPVLPPSDPGFEGGQCPVDYFFNFQRTQNGQPQTPQQLRLRGPIQGIVEVPVENSASVSYDVVYDGGAQSRSLTSGLPDQTGATVVSVFRVDGLPDNCGDPAPQPPPGQPPATDPRPPSTVINIDFPDIGPVDVTFGPIVGIVYTDIDARIKIPVKVNIELPDLEFSPSFYFNIDLSDPDAPITPITPAPPEDDDGRPAPPDCPLPPECEEEPDLGPEDDREPEEEDEKGRVVTGALILSVRNGQPIRQTEINQGVGGSVFVPYVALATVVYETPEGNLAYSADVPIKRIAQVVEAPKIGLKVLTVACTWEKGWNGEVLIIRDTLDCG